MRTAVSSIVPLTLLAQALAAGDWPQFRGPDGEGHAAETSLPLSWSETENIAWKTPIPGRGWSSPVVLGDRIWLTTAVDEGRSLHALCVDRDAGTLLRDVEVFRKEDPGAIHGKNSHASPTPVLEPDRVYVHFGAHGTACLGGDGRVIWQTELRYAHRHGPAGSPVLHGDLLILSCDGTDVQFVVALEKETGKVRWRRDRAGPMAYSTPLVIRGSGPGGEPADQVVSTGGGRAAAYDPRTGDEIWSCRYEGYSLVPRPVHASGPGLVFLCTGYDSPSLLAVRLGGRGDVTESGIAWSLKRGVPHTSSPLLCGDDLYFVSDNGVASCLEAATGRLRWQARLGGSFSASPLLAGGRIYFLDEDGVTTVVAPGPEPKKLAVNALEGRTLASMAVAGPAIFVRTDSRLYRIEEKARPARAKEGG